MGDVASSRGCWVGCLGVLVALFMAREQQANVANAQNTSMVAALCSSADHSCYNEPLTPDSTVSTFDQSPQLIQQL